MDVFVKSTRHLSKPKSVYVPSEESQWHPVPRDQIDSWLVLYPPDERFLTDIFYQHGTLCGMIQPHHATYTFADVPYLTASQLTLVASQSGYLLSGAALCDMAYAAAPSHYYDLFLQRLRAVQLYYTKINFRFRRQLSNDAAQPFRVAVTGTRIHFRTLFAEFSLDCGEGGATASMTMAMPL